MMPLCFGEFDVWSWADNAWATAYVWQGVYADKMRSSLFTGFLTLASFLMAVASFLIVNLKTHVFDKESYLQEWMKANPSGESRDIYLPLEKLAKRFAVNILLALAASVSQFTIGMIVHPLAAAACLVIALLAFGHLFLTIRHFVAELKAMTAWLHHDGHPKDTPPAAK